MKQSPPSFPKVQVLSKGENGYPEKMLLRLQNKAPDKLYCLGNASLFKRNSLAFCGSRDVTEKGLEIASDCARQTVENRKVVVSGNARGVDRMVHKTALECGGSTILVLPEGLDHFRIHKDLQAVWDWERVLVVSEFPLNTPWKTWNAMKRNKTILALVTAMIVIEAGEKGGTLAAGKAALDMRVPLFVINRTDMDASLGGKQLLDLGGRKLQKSVETDKANMSPVLQAMADQVRVSASLSMPYSLL